MRIELITVWYNEEFLAPFFLNHYSWVDKIHILLDADTNDRTESVAREYPNVEVQPVRFPDMMDDALKVQAINNKYQTLTKADYVMVVDSDEFIFCNQIEKPVRLHLESTRKDIYFANLWQIYEHENDPPLNPNEPVPAQRRHGDPNMDDPFNVLYIKPAVVKGGKSLHWTPGNHELVYGGHSLSWRARDVPTFKSLNVSVERAEMLQGSHWRLVDLKETIKRRILNRKQRQSKVNLTQGLTTQYHHITEEDIIREYHSNKNQPVVLFEDGFPGAAQADDAVGPAGAGQGAPAQPQGEPAPREGDLPVPTIAPYYSHRRDEIVSAVPASAMSVLDVGCAGGAVGKALRELVPGRRVAGIEQNPGAAAHARQLLDAVYQADVEVFEPPFKGGEFDCILFADVLEHLKDPWTVLRRLVRFLKPGGTVVASVPNVRRLTVVLELADKGRWEYQDEGILDRTHLRFFTKAMFKALLHEAGIGQLTVSNLNGEDLRQYAPAADRTVRIGRLRMQDVSPEEFEELSALQFLFVGTYEGVAAPAEGDAGSCLDDARTGEHPEEKPEGAPNGRSTDLTLNLSFVPPAQAPVASLTHQWGFYDDEGGWRWMSEAGQLLAPPSAKPSVFKADVACGKLSWYGGGSRNQTPLEVAVIVDGQTRQSLRFESDMQTLPIEQEIPASDKEVAIQLQSNKDYVPVENGINQDGRHLAVRLINPRLDAAQLPGRQNETPVSVNRATTPPVFQPSPASPAPPGSAGGGEGGAEALRFGEGFYDDEGGWRWMAGAGCLWVPRWATPATLSFRVGCAEESCYSAFPFDLTICVGEESVYMHSIASSDKLLEIRLPIQPAAADVPVSLESRQVFVPARNGASADVRELSVRLSHFNLKRADGAGANGHRPRVTGNGQSAARPAGGIKPPFKGPAKDEAYNHALAAYAADPTVMFELSSKCNFRCSYCRSASSQRTGSFMKREVFTHLVRQAKEITTRPLRLHVDGEPTLHPAFLDMALEANAAGHTLALATNGSALKPEFLQIDMCVVLNLSCSAKELASRSSIDYHRYHARIAKYLLAWKNGDSKQEFYFKIYTSGVERQNAANLQRKHRFAKKYVQDLGLGEGGTWQENGVITSFNCPKPGGGLFSLTIQPLAEGGCYPNADHHPCPGTGLPEQCGFCDSPWKVLAVLADGTVAFCCVDITGETGYTRPEELWEMSLKDLWLKHPGIRQARLEFLAGRISRPICRKCLEASPHREMYLFPELFPYPPK